MAFLAFLVHFSMLMDDPYFSGSAEIMKLGRRLQLRQLVLATAQIYVRRFYCRVELRRTNPYLVMATAVYLAGKMEECPVHIRVVVNEARNAWPGKRIPRPRSGRAPLRLTPTTLDFITTDASAMGECEFWLIAEMKSQLIVHHPYRTLMDLLRRLSLTTDETSLAWAVINDHYLTDLPLLHPPHVIAVAAILLTAIKPGGRGVAGDPPRARGGSRAIASSSATQRWAGWVAESEIDMEAIVDCTQEMMSLYDVWEQYHERLCREPIARFVRPP